VKKKFSATPKDKSDWNDFTRDMPNISVKKADLFEENISISKIKKLDLHGFSLAEANRSVKKFIINSFNKGFKKILVITGKGLRSKSYQNPYTSEKLSILKYSIPEYIKNDDELNDKVSRISQADEKDGGDGAIYIFLRKNKML
tara:strand:+ start:303 stop:734 length:432 start_codon:yes stop_codon:yes gene_type:complete